MLLATVIMAVVASIMSYWIFEWDLEFLPVPVIAGIVIVILQQQNKVYKFLDKLIIYSLTWGILTDFFMAGQRYLIMSPQQPSYPFIYYFFNYKDALMLTGGLSFVAMLGGLLGIVIKGIYTLYFKKK